MKLNWDEFFKISQAQKPNNFKPPDWEKVKIVIAGKLEILNDDKLHERMVELKSRYGKFVKTKNSKGCAERPIGCKDVVLDSEDFTPIPSPENLTKKQKTKNKEVLGSVRRETVEDPDR